MRPGGSDFRRRVWQVVAAIPYGQTRTYGQLAEAVGRPDRIRAVGAANGRNPLAIVVPCHRVVAGDGGLTGYAGGLARKRFLLDLERPCGPRPERLS
jgi:methylated-DNA-[protein]-cysteine S-methyltransferase